LILFGDVFHELLQTSTSERLQDVEQEFHHRLIVMEEKINSIGSDIGCVAAFDSMMGDSIDMVIPANLKDRLLQSEHLGKNNNATIQCPLDSCSPEIHLFNYCPPSDRSEDTPSPLFSRGNGSLDVELKAVFDRDYHLSTSLHSPVESDSRSEASMNLGQITPM